MDRRRAAGALLALAACIACSTAAPTASNQTALGLFEGPSEGCYYNFQHYGEGDRIMTNEPCLNCTCHNRMLMCYLKVCPFTKPIGQDCTIEKRADQCCPIVTCPDVPVDLLTSTSTSSPAEYGATGLGKVDKYGCSINGKYFPEGSKVPPTPNKPCEHCYCIRNMTTCVMQECTLHVDGCTPIYKKDVCCPVRYSCDHLEDEMLLLDDMTTTVRPTPGFLLTTTTMPSVTQISQNCVHDDQIFADGALIKTEVACEHCYCMKGDIVCVVQECGTPMENEGKNCTSLPPRQGQCCPDTYICEGDELLPEPTTSVIYEELTTLSPPRRVEGSGYRNEPDEPYTEIPAFEGSGEEHATTLDSSDIFTPQKQTPQIIDEIFTPTEESQKPSLTTIEPDKEQNTVPDDSHESTSDSHSGKTTLAQEATTTAQPSGAEGMKETDTTESKTTSSDYLHPSEADSFISKDDEFILTTESVSHYTKDESSKITEMKSEAETTESFMEEMTTQQSYSESLSSEPSTVYKQDDKTTMSDVLQLDENSQPQYTTPQIPKDDSENYLDKDDTSVTQEKEDTIYLMTTTESRIEPSETTSVNPVENEIDEDILPPGRIPGEGDCLLNGVTYKNSTNVPNINNCHSSCKCVSSIIKCDPIICSPPPEQMDNMNDCQPIYDTPDACCPTYICHSRETIPPESHSQMSGTESPKPLLESECHGEQCQPHKSKPIPPEPCNSEGCEPVMEDQERECKNGVCGNTDTSTNTDHPPLKHPEDCIGDTCMPSDEICTDGKCQPSPTSQTICDNENGCQPSEACEGNKCAGGIESTVAKEELPICEGAQCDTSIVDTPVPDKNIVQPECKEEICRRKDQTEENSSPHECSGSTCITQKTEGESGDLTTESAIKDQVYKESTTEMNTDSYSKLPESEKTPSDETQKVTQVEAMTENQDLSLEHSTAKSEGSTAEDLSQTVTEKGESYTDSSDSHETKMEETITEIYKPETEDTDDKKQVTESIEGVTKETFTDFPFTTQYDKHPSDLPKEDISDMPTKPFEGSTETLDIKPHDEGDHDEVTETSIVKDFTQTQEIFTKPTYTPETSTKKLLETDVTEQEITNKEEVFTETPKQEQNTIKTQDRNDENTESQQNVFITESSVPLLPEMTTEDHVDVKVKDDEVKSTEENGEITNIPVQSTTEQFVQIKESSEPHETKLDETATKKIDDEIEKDNISTENPNVFKEVIPTDTAIHDLHKIDKETESPETTEAPVEDHENLNKQTEMFDTVTDKQEAYTTPNEIQEHVTTVSSIIHATQPATTEENLITQTHDAPYTEKDESNVPESPIKASPTSTIPQDFDIKEITTLQPEMPITIAPEITDVKDISSQTVSDKLGEQTVTSIKDINEVTTITPEKTSQDDTDTKADTEPSIVEPHKNDIPTNVIPIDEAGLGTTISSTSSDKDHEITTKYSDMGSDMEHTEEITVMPEVHSTKSEEYSSLYDETEKKTLETSTISEVESVAVTTESLKVPYEDKNEIPDIMHTDSQTQEPSIDEHTLAPTITHTEGYGDTDDKTISVSIDETKEEPQYTTPETVSQFTEKQDAVLMDDHVTEGAEDETKGTDSSKEPHEPTEHSVSNEMEDQHIVTHAFETTTQSQDTVTKSATELQTDQEISSTPTHVVKDEKVQTESPMSLITEPSEFVHSEDADDSTIAKTTQIPQERIPEQEETKTPDYSGTKPQIPDTEYPHIQEMENTFDSKTTPQTHPQKENQPESQETTSPQEYTTAKILDIYNEEKTPGITSTEVAEKLIPTTEYQDTMFTLSPVKPYSELYPTDVKHESTSEVPVKVSSEESFATEEHEEISTRYPEMSGSITTVVDDHEFEIKPENVPVKDHTSEDTTEQPQNNVDFTTADGITEHQGDTQQSDKVDDSKDSEHAIPSEFTTKYPEILDNSQDKQTNEPEPNKQEDHTETPVQKMTTEALFSPEQPLSDHEKSTEVLQASDEKDITTPRYQDLSTLKEESIPEPHLTTGDISTTESSELLPSEENNRRTLSPLPNLETIQPDQYTTEKKIITELPEKTKPEEMEQTEISDETSSNTPQKESATLEPITEAFDHITSIPAATEGNIPLVTETVPSYQDQKIPVVTESIEKHTSEEQDVTSKPGTEFNDIKDIQTEQPFQSETEDTTNDKTTVYDDLINLPKDTTPVEIPSEYTVAHESQTESSIPKETEISEPTATEASVLVDTESDTSIPIETDTSVSKATEPSTLKESELIPKVTEASVSKETESAESEVPKETEHIVSEITEASIPKETESAVSEITEASVPKETEHIVSEITETAIPKETESAVSEITEASVPKESEPAVSEVTEASVHEVSEVSVTEVMETSVTDYSKPKAPEVSESSQTEIAEAAVSDITEASVTESSEPKTPEITESSKPKTPEIMEVSEPKTPEVTEASEPKKPEVTVASKPEVTGASQSDVTEASQPDVTEASQPDVTVASQAEVTEASQSEVTGASQSEVTKASQPEVTGASQSEVTGASQPEVTGASQSEVTGASQSEVTEASQPEVTGATQSEVTEASQPEVTGASQPEVTEASQPEITEGSIPEITKDSVPEVTEASVPEITKATSSEITEISPAEGTEISVAEVTESFIPKDTETTVPKETESEIINREPEGTTYKPKDEKLETPVEESPTLEPIHSSSETTPYLVELQEHTTKVDEDISSVTLTEEDRTKAPEIYYTERGDQPLDNIPDKFTQEDSQEELTTKETFTKKDEQVTTLPPEQASEYTEKLPDKTDVVTEEISISSESPMSTLLNAQITTQAASSGEESITISPTVSVALEEHDKHTTTGFEIETTADKKDGTLETEKTPEHEVMHEETSPEDAFIPVVTKATTIKTPEESTTHLPVEDNKFTKPEDKPSEPYSPTTAPELPKPGISEIQPTEELPSPDFAPTGSSGYGQEPDYVEEDQAFGPGTCRYGGKVYVSAQQIPRDDPCDFCFCFRSDIICLQQSCPPPIHGCHEEPIQGFCCPRYECPVSMATTLNVTTTTTTTTTTLPPHFLPHAYKGAAQRRGCQIKGHSYKVGEVVRASSGPCLHCTCGGDGQMKCDPKACTPEPMLRQMIAAAVSAKRRR